MANRLVNLLRGQRQLRESVSASAEPQLQRAQGGNGKDDDELEESVTAASRKSAEKSGDTMAGGKYPVRNQAEADKAWNLRNNGDADEASVVAHIRAMVKKHGLTMPGGNGKTQEADRYGTDGHRVGVGTDPNLTRFVEMIREADVRRRGTGSYEVTILQEGPGHAGGSNGDRYYTKDALREAVRKGQFEGLQAYLNHPTRQEEQERPERDVRYLAGQFKEARFIEGNPAEVRAIFTPGGMDKDRVIQLIESALDSPQDKPLIGISIDGAGRVERSDIGGKTYDVVREVAHIGSADIVTRAGAGGRFHRRLKEHNPGMADRRPDVSKEATVMNAAQLQEKVRAAASKLAEAAGLKDDDDRANGLIEEGLTLLRECEAATVEAEVREVEKRVEVPVAAEKDSKADELAAKLQEAQTTLAAEKQRADDAEDKIREADSAKLAAKVLREAKVPEKSARSWFDAVAGCDGEDAMRQLVDTKMAEREEILADIRESVGVEGAGPRQPALTGAGNNGGGSLYGALGLDRDDD